MVDYTARISSTDFLHPAILRRFNAARLAQQSNPKIIETYRTVERQRFLYAQGRTAPGPVVTNALPWHGWHNYGLAFDIWFDASLGGEPYRDFAPFAKGEGLIWGGDFANLADLGHYELTAGLTIAEAQQLVADGGLMSVWIALSDRLGG